MNIHRIFRQEAFRNAKFPRNLSVPQLSAKEFHLPDIVYERMKPALRLATLLVKIAMPNLWRIYQGNIEETAHEASPVEALSLGFHWIEEDINDFDEYMLGHMSETYRFTVFTCDRSGNFFPAALTFASKHGQHSAVGLSSLYPQTALNSEWIQFLSSNDWDTISDEEKYGRLFILATTLLRELTHAIWAERCLKHMPTKMWKQAEDGEIDYATEPQFHPEFQTCPELGYGLLSHMFNGSPDLPQGSSHSTPIEPSGKGPSYRVSFSRIDYNGRVMRFYTISRHSIFYIFDLRENPLWKPWVYGGPPGEHKPPKFWLDWMRDPTPLLRPRSSILSAPEDWVPEVYCGQVPIIRTPHPNDLEPAITSFNELVPRDSDGNMLHQTKSHLRNPRK